MARQQHPNSLANLKRPVKGGPSPNPSGRPKDILTQALRRLVDDDEAKQLMRALLAECRDGNVKAMALAWERLEGKVTDKHELSGPDGAPLATGSPVVALSSDELRRILQVAGDGNGAS